MNLLHLDSSIQGISSVSRSLSEAAERRLMRSFEHAETYLCGAFGFVGITQAEVVIAQGVAFGPEQREAALKAALAEIELLPRVA